MHPRHALAAIALTLTALCLPHASASPALEDLFERAWEADLKQNPLLASNLGDLRYNDQWPNLSLAAIDASHASDKAFLAEIKAMDASKLEGQDRVNYDLFQREYAERVANHRFRTFLIPLNQRGGIQTANQIVDRLRFDSEQSYEDWLVRLQNFDTYMDQTIALMRQGVREGLVHPKVIMERLPAQIGRQLVDVADSPFLTPFETQPEFMPDRAWAKLTKAAHKAVSDEVLPAYREFYRFFEEEYLPACRESVGVWGIPDGREYYAERVKQFTTTDLTPDEVHEIGLKEVARIRSEMMKIIEQVEFEGDFKAFLNFLRTDDQFYFDNADDLYTEYLAVSKRIDPELVKLFNNLPRMPYGVKPIPDAIAPDTTTAYYSRPAADGSRAGYYYVNLYRPEVRPKYEIEVLTVHEAMPGHHLQIALSQELGELPPFRRYGGYTAFVEGWALYSESLGADLGLYKDPYSRFGQLTYEMWRAVRLVVDTGMHHKEWNRQQAIDFFRDNAAKTEHDIVNEIDRYIAWPGQALAYKIGELRIKELRARAEKALGDNFDIRAFHDVVLR
ncbi:MAG: DUF885 domain-containing protein, partial [Xanthomonadales bacterium]|nr:DUF885 domain-containing protein [Xanthomonadales bacterium]